MFYKWIKRALPKHLTDLSFIMYFGEDIIYAAVLSNALLHFMFNHLCLMIFAPFIKNVYRKKSNLIIN